MHGLRGVPRRGTDHQKIASAGTLPISGHIVLFPVAGAHRPDHADGPAMGCWRRTGRTVLAPPRGGNGFRTAPDSVTGTGAAPLSGRLDEPALLKRLRPPIISLLPCPIQHWARRSAPAWPTKRLRYRPWRVHDPLHMPQTSTSFSRRVRSHCTKLDQRENPGGRTTCKKSRSARPSA